MARQLIVTGCEGTHVVLELQGTWGPEQSQVRAEGTVNIQETKSLKPIIQTFQPVASAIRKKDVVMGEADFD